MNKVHSFNSIVRFLSGVAILGLAAVSMTIAQADELDRNGNGKMPSAIIVRKDMNNHSVEVFKAEGLPKVSSPETSAKAIAKFVSEKNKIEKIAEKSELDRGSSVDSWYSYPCSPYSPYYPYYGNTGYPSYYYGYYYYGSYYNYYPYYGYNYGNYSYYYYYYNYGYNNYWWY